MNNKSRKANVSTSKNSTILILFSYVLIASESEKKLNLVKIQQLHHGGVCCKLKLFFVVVVRCFWLLFLRLIFPLFLLLSSLSLIL